MLYKTFIAVTLYSAALLMPGVCRFPQIFYIGRPAIREHRQFCFFLQMSDLQVFGVVQIPLLLRSGLSPCGPRACVVWSVSFCVC